MHAKTNHTSAYVSDDISSPMCVSDDTSSPIGRWHLSPWKSKHFNQSYDATCLGEKVLKALPIRLWHMPPIKLRHVSLTHPQTLINRNIPKAFLHTKIPWERSWNTPRDQDILGQTKATMPQAASKKIQKYRSSVGIKP